MRYQDCSCLSSLQTILIESARTRSKGADKGLQSCRARVDLLGHIKDSLHTKLQQRLISASQASSGSAKGWKELHVEIMNTAKAYSKRDFLHREGRSGHLLCRRVRTPLSRRSPRPE